MKKTTILQLQKLLDEATESGLECGCQLAIYENGELVADLCSGYTTPDRRRFFKSVELMPHPDFHSLPESDREALLRSLHDTDGPDGEPGWPVPREAVQWLP